MDNNLSPLYTFARFRLSCLYENNGISTHLHHIARKLFKVRESYNMLDDSFHHRDIHL